MNHFFGSLREVAQNRKLRVDYLGGDTLLDSAAGSNRAAVHGGTLTFSVPRFFDAAGEPWPFIGN